MRSRLPGVQALHTPRVQHRLMFRVLPTPRDYRFLREGKCARPEIVSLMHTSSFQVHLAGQWERRRPGSRSDQNHSSRPIGGQHLNPAALRMVIGVQVRSEIRSRVSLS